ncbi:MAG TPA: hypothetical protein DF863_00430 [Gammaproteobacteria bacterium]|nr:hypothetical protein [Gammaproteobacteria bacterium]
MRALPQKLWRLESGVRAASDSLHRI